MAITWRENVLIRESKLIRKSLRTPDPLGIHDSATQPGPNHAQILNGNITVRSTQISFTLSFSRQKKLATGFKRPSRTRNRTQEKTPSRAREHVRASRRRMPIGARHAYREGAATAAVLSPPPLTAPAAAGLSRARQRAVSGRGWSCEKRRAGGPRARTLLSTSAVPRLQEWLPSCETHCCRPGRRVAADELLPLLLRPCDAKERSGFETPHPPASVRYRRRRHAGRNGQISGRLASIQTAQKQLRLLLSTSWHSRVGVAAAAAKGSGLQIERPVLWLRPH